MNSKRVMLVSFILLAILAIGVASASEDADTLAVDDNGGDDAIVEQSSSSVDEEIVESQEPLTYANVSIGIDGGKDFTTVSGSDDEEDTSLICVEIPKDAVNCSIVVSSGTNAFFNKKVEEINNFWGGQDWDSITGYQITPKDVNFFKGLKNDDLVKISLVQNDKSVASKIQKITFENNRFRLEDPFNAWVWDSEWDGPFYLDSTRDMVSVNVWSPGINGVFHVSCNGKVHKYKVNYAIDENGGYRNWVLSSFAITEPGLYPVTVSYGTEDDAGDVIEQRVVNVKEFNYDVFRAVLSRENYMVSLYCPENAQGNIALFVKYDYEQDFPEEPVTTHVIAPDDYNKWLNWTFDELGCQMENGYNILIKIEGNRFYEDGFWYNEYWSGGYVPDEPDVEIYGGDLGDPNEWVAQLLIPELSNVSSGTFKIVSGTKTLFTKQINILDMDMDTDNRLYRYEVLFKDLNKNNFNKLANNNIITFEFTYGSDSAKRMVFLEKNTNDGYIGFNSFVYVNEDVYLDHNDSVASVDVWTKGITGVFYVFCNGYEYRYKVNYAEDENGGNFWWTLDSFNITEAGEYPITFRYGTPDNPGDVICKSVMNVREYNYDVFRVVTYSHDNLIRLYCPENAEGTISIFLKRDDADNYPAKPVITHKINSGDYNKWLNWTYKELGCKLENGYNILVKINNDNQEIFDYEEFLWYETFYPRDDVPNQTTLDINPYEIYDSDDEGDSNVLNILIPEKALISNFTVKITSGAKTIYSKDFNIFDLSFDSDYRLYEHAIRLNDLNINGLNNGDTVTVEFTYDNGTVNTIKKVVLFGKYQRWDDDSYYRLSYAYYAEANILDDDVILVISEFPEGVSDEFNISAEIWDNSEVTTWKISELSKNTDGLYVWKCSDLKFDRLMYDVSDTDYRINIEFLNESVGGENLIYANPSFERHELSLLHDDVPVIMFVKKPKVDENFIISIKKDGSLFKEMQMTLSKLEKYYDKGDERYYFGLEDLGITENGKYEIATIFTRDGNTLSYNTTFDVVDFVIGVRYDENNPYVLPMDDINRWIYAINLLENATEKVVVSVNGTPVLNKTLSAIGYMEWNRMGAYYISLNDLQITESGRYDVTIEVYDASDKLLRTFSSPLAVNVTPNTFEFCDFLYDVDRRGDGDDFLKISFGSPLSDGTIVTLYLNGQKAASTAIGSGFDLVIDESFMDNKVGCLKPGNYLAKLTLDNGTGEVTVAEGSFRILTQSGNVNVSLENDDVLSVDNVAILVTAIKPENLTGDYILRIVVDPDFDGDEELLHIDIHELEEELWYDASTKKFDLGTLDAGTHCIYVYYGFDEYGEAVEIMSNDFYANRFDLTVKKTPTSLVASKVSTTYKSGKKLLITLKDSKGKAIAKKKITIKVGTISKTLTTNSKGQVSLDVSTLAPKTYTATIKFAGDKNFNAATKKVTVAVKKATPKFKATVKKYKANVKTKKYSVTVKISSTPLKKVKLTLKVKGVTYKAKTNSKGVATFKVTKLAKKGTYKAVVKIAGTKYYKAASKTIKIAVK